jgi:hypothetical protein
MSNWPHDWSNLAEIDIGKELGAKQGWKPASRNRYLIYLMILIA